MILIAIGSNLSHARLGPPRAVCEAALRRLQELGVTVRKRSRWYESAPVPPSDQPWFINGLFEAALPPDCSPRQLLDLLHQVEAEFGRERSVRDEARVLDLDLIDFNGRVSEEGEVPVLPHPRLHERGFVVLPLSEVAPDWCHPVTGKAIAAIKADLPRGQQARPVPEV